MGKGIVVLADHRDGKLKPTTWELLAGADKIQELAPGTLSAVVMGVQVEEPAQELARSAGVDVLALHVPGLISYNGETCKAVLSKVLPEWDPAYVLAMHNTDTWDYVPGLAARLGGVCVTGVVGLAPCHGSVQLRRIVANGRLVADVAADRRPLFLTLDPGAFPRDSRDATVSGRVVRRSMPYAPRRCRSLHIRRTKSRSSVLADARIVVAAGKGMGRRENLEMIDRLAGLFQNAAVGGSRLVCDSGWLEYPFQVGLTGATVRPDLYVACGISGAPQHLAGMAGSRFIVAINTDPNASIFNVSDVCIVEDATTFLPVLIQTIQKAEKT
jgi:electron transfer flavoprotein alpha subunit